MRRNKKNIVSNGGDGVLFLGTDWLHQPGVFKINDVVVNLVLSTSYTPVALNIPLN